MRASLIPTPDSSFSLRLSLSLSLFLLLRGWVEAPRAEQRRFTRAYIMQLSLYLALPGSLRFCSEVQRSLRALSLFLPRADIRVFGYACARYFLYVALYRANSFSRARFPLQLTINAKMSTVRVSTFLSPPLPFSLFPLCTRAAAGAHNRFHKSNYALDILLVAQLECVI